MFTDVRNSSTELLMTGVGAEELIAKTFDTTIENGVAVLTWRGQPEKADDS